MASTIDIALTDADYGLLLTALHTHEQLATRQSGSPDAQTAERWREELRRTQELASRLKERRSEFAICEGIAVVTGEPVIEKEVSTPQVSSEDQECPDR